MIKFYAYVEKNLARHLPLDRSALTYTFKFAFLSFTEKNMLYTYPLFLISIFLMSKVIDTKILHFYITHDYKFPLF
jgi:hypothetical protein